MISSLDYWDIAIILIYFGIILWIAQWASKSKSDSGSAVDYFLAGKNSGWLVIGASLFASNIGSEIILGVSGAGARGNMPMANFEIIAALVLILLGWVFVPFYLRTGVYTMPEFLEKRYSKACRNYLSVISILAYVITKISLIIFAGALVFETIGISFLDRCYRHGRRDRILYGLGRTKSGYLYRHGASLYFIIGHHSCYFIRSTCYRWLG